MDKSEYENIVALLETFADQACEAFEAYGELTGIENANRYSFVEADSGEVTFEWEETWSYGGREHHRRTMPVRWLYDRDALTQEIRAAHAAAKERMQEQERERVAQKETADKERYQELHARYGSLSAVSF